jgi:hypothetical protein
MRHGRRSILSLGHESSPDTDKEFGGFMTMERLLELLRDQEVFLKTAQHGYIEILADRLGPGLHFETERELCNFANSKGDWAKQILIKKSNGQRIIFVETGEYDAIFAYDGSFSLREFWKREMKKAEAQAIDFEKFKAEVMEHFSSVKNPKLAS